ncbi:hypothetical protein [Algoriphagus marinus]|uniref:hypothetical protein n=1 Tax=Algoriphagus marinus TaxID=1925762 RepID=UPI00094B8A40|nr:hypothetical protein [Algoriphagus marinus]
MKIKILTSLLLFTFFFIGYAQSNLDTLFLTDGETKGVKIIEVGKDEIKYSYPNETTVYSINRFLVEKIKFSSGREEIIEIPFKEVNGLNDVDQVFVTYNPIEINGLLNLGELYSKATGVTVFSNMSNVKNRSLDKMKTEASMIGANVVLISNAQSRGNYYGNENSPSQSTQTVFFGQAYTSTPINVEQLSKVLQGLKLVHHQTHSLNRNDFSPKSEISLRYDENRKPVINQITNLEVQNGRLYASIKGFRSKTDELEVIRFQDGILTIMEKHKNSVINYIFYTEGSDFMKSVQTIL